MAPRPYILAETNWKTVKEVNYEVVVLPWGATEAHNYHLPYGTDNFQCDYVAAESAKVAWEKGAKVIVLPTIPFGVNTGQLDISLDINMMPSTQMAILKDVVDVMARQKIKKLVVFNGHGGNNFQQMLRELQALYPSVFLCTISWFKVIDGKGYFNDPGDHAGAMETSAMLHIAPDWVLDLSTAGEGYARPFKLAAFHEGWAWAQRQWSQVTDDTGVGNPYESTPEKGRQYLEAVTKKIGEFLWELSTADSAKMYADK